MSKKEKYKEPKEEEEENADGSARKLKRRRSFGKIGSRLLRNTQSVSDVSLLEVRKSYYHSIGSDTQAGTLPGESQPKVNQDSHFIVKKYEGADNLLLVGVADGHGTNGQFVSQYISHKLPFILAKSFGHDYVTKLKKQSEVANMEEQPTIIENLFTTYEEV